MVHSGLHRLRRRHCPGESLTGVGRPAAVQSSRANTNAAKSTSCASSKRRASVVVPGLRDVVQGSTCATSSRPRVSACTSFFCIPDEPRKMRGLSIGSSKPLSFAEPIEMSTKGQRRTSRASSARPLGALAWCQSRGEPYSPLGFRPRLRCGLGGNSGTQEGQQVGIYRVCIRGRHAVREALVGL